MISFIIMIIMIDVMIMIMIMIMMIIMIIMIIIIVMTSSSSGVNAHTKCSVKRFTTTDFFSLSCFWNFWPSNLSHSMMFAMVSLSKPKSKDMVAFDGV